MSDLRLRNSRVFWQLCYDSQHLFISSRNASLINVLTEVLFMMGSTTLQFINPLFYQGFMIVIWERLWFFFLLALATTVLVGCYTTRNSVHHKITIWPHNLDTPALNGGKSKYCRVYRRCFTHWQEFVWITVREGLQIRLLHSIRELSEMATIYFMKICILYCIPKLSVFQLHKI